MKKLLCLLALMAIPMYMMGQEQGAGTAKDINKEVLTGRPVTEKPITPAMGNCIEEGTVVLNLKVDRTGTVKSAEMAKGTTNNAPCLLEYARAVALATKFTPKEDAPELQEGTMTFNFKQD